MDKLIVRDLEIYGYHGVHPAGDNAGEKFTISAELILNLKEAGDTDRISRTINYIELCKELEEVFTGSRHKLMERCAEELATHILLNYAIVQHVFLSIKKPWAPIGKPLKYVGIEIQREWHTVYVGLGSNLGDRLDNLQTAVVRINESELTRVSRISKIYETDPVGYLDQDSFLNCAIEIKTLLAPRDLIELLLSIEKSLLRERVVHWGPRTIDLDILFYDTIVTSFPEAVVPHPRLHERMFVLKPLHDIAPFFMHPVLNKRVFELMISNEAEDAGIREHDAAIVL